MKLPLGKVLATSLAFCLVAGCASRGAMPPARSAEQEPADGGLPIPPAPAKKGIIVPSDVGSGANPGTTPTAGTNDNGLGSPIGTAPGH